MDLFNDRVFSDLENSHAWTEIYVKQGENRVLMEMQKTMILGEIDKLIKKATPETAWGDIQYIKGMMHMSYENLCEIASKKGVIHEGRR